MPDVHLRDVTLRDGLQDEAVVTTENKLALFTILVAAGVVDLELTSFVRPDRVPAMADAAELAAQTADHDGVQRWALALNTIGAQRAIAAGLNRIQFVISVSDAHSIRNAGRSTSAALADLRMIVDGLAVGTEVEVTLATSFGCPYEGPIRPKRVMEVLDGVLAAGVSGVSLADTIGTAVPKEVRSLVAAVVAETGGVPVGAHLHDTRGLGIINAIAALESGAGRIDGSLGGLGGCPFAPGASGNLALEDLVHMFEAEGIDTGLQLDLLLEAAHLACTMVTRPITSHVGAAGPRFRTSATGRRSVLT